MVYVGPLSQEVNDILSREDYGAFIALVREHPQTARQVVAMLATKYPTIRNMLIYLTVGKGTASTVASFLIRRLAKRQWDPEYETILDILALFIDISDADDIIKLLGPRTPISLAYVPYTGTSISTYMEYGVPIDFVWHYLMRLGTTATLEDIGKILSYPPVIMREKTYYVALQKYAKDHSTSEIDILRQIHTFQAYDRLQRILSLFPNPQIWYPVGICHNDMGLTDSMSEVPPILRYQIQEGTTTYCLSVSDVYGMVMAGNSRNPYTGGTLSLDDMVGWLIDLLEQGYPIAHSTASDFYDPIVYDPTMFDLTTRTNDMLHTLGLSLYRNEARNLANDLQLPALSLQRVPMLMRMYGGDIGAAIRVAYPGIGRIWNSLHLQIP